MIDATAVLKAFINAPDLLPSEAFTFNVFQFYNETVETSQFNFPTTLVVGKQAEVCFEYFLKHSNRYRLIAANLQIQGTVQTLGELDYLLKDLTTNKTLHVELACKFYLYDPEVTGKITEKWIGPNRKDSLDYKLQKVVQKQFPLLFASETALILKDLEVDPFTIEQQLCIKLFLFLPKHFQQPEVATQLANRVYGYYVTASEFLKEEDPEATYALVDKKEWLLPLENCTSWCSFNEIQPLITAQITNKRSPLLYKKTAGHIEKFFVVWW